MRSHAGRTGRTARRTRTETGIGWTTPRAARAAALALLAGCSGLITNPSAGPSGGPGTGGTGAGLTGGGGGAPGVPNPGTVAIHRLNALEYDNTVNDLLGLQQRTAQTSFIPDEKGANGFDNEAGPFTMTGDELTQYFNSADALGEQVFASPALAAKIVTCKPTGASDKGCLDAVINGFGARAYRRPLTPDELAQFEALAADAVTNGQDFNGEVKQIVKAMLTSLPFLYRIEADADPASTTVHRLSSYELATRLSYLVWSSMPDDQLFKDAQSGALLADATLGQELARMLEDPRAQSFVASFAGQWFGVRELGSHGVEATAFPAWNETIRQAMMREMSLYFGEFMSGNLPWTQFLTAPINFVNGPLAAFYGIKNVPATQTTFTKVMNADPNRIGFMGLGGFLANTSFSYRTVPTERGKWVLMNILGEYVPPVPVKLPPPLDAPGSATSTTAQAENVRARLAVHRADAGCGACHNLMDPIGLGLENFDGIGKYRTTYGDGEAVDSSGALPDGTMFSSLTQLTSILSMGKRADELAARAVKQVLTYATARELDQSADAPYVAQLQQQWAAQGYTLPALIQDVVLSDPFRSRHGGI